MRKVISMIMAALVASTLATTAAATTFSFSFEDDPQAYIYARTHLGGAVTGIIHGLEDNVANQAPVAIEFTSDVSAFGMTDTYVDVFGYTAGSGFTVTNGQITAANYFLNWSDPTVGGMQLRFNYYNATVGSNHLIWNGGSGPIVGIGNQDGFAGATFTNVNVVPLPAALPLMLIAFGGFGVVRQAGRRKAAIA